MKSRLSEQVKMILPRNLSEKNMYEYAEAINYLCINLTSTVLYFGFIFYYRYKVVAPHISNMCILSVGLSLFALFLFYKNSKTQLSSNITMFTAFLVLTYSSINGHGINSPAVFWNLVAIMMGVFILKERYIILWYGVFSVATAAVYLHQELGFEVISIIKDPLVLEKVKILHIEIAMFLTLLFSLSFSKFKTSIIYQLNEKQEELTIKLEENKSLTRFLSHDIASSLTVLKMVSHHFEKNVREEDRKHIDKMKNSLRRAQDVVEQVRQFQAIHDGKIKFELKLISIHSLVDYVEQIHTENALSKGIKIDLSNLEEFKTLEIYADEASFYPSIVSNLISNAVKFTKAGDEIKISGHFEESQNHKWFCLMIKDYGIGMPLDILENIFRSDYQTSRVGLRGEKGTGFGMPIVKSFIDLYGGKIEIESRPVADYPSNSGTEIKLYFKYDAYLMNNQKSA
ncbi:MAG: HAMP domain-containing histidine kinase [Bacteriovorax sp.]|nr:HAMP domain-containing histidine kinase [Bacteriovorax sp.]